MAIFSDWFGSNASAKPLYYKDSRSLLNSLADVGKNALSTLGTANQDAAANYRAGTDRQNALLDQQASIFQNLLSRNATTTPLDLYKGVSDTLFGYIQPNVLNPLADWEVNRARADARARGSMNNAYQDGTYNRLSAQQGAARVYSDLAKTIYPQINPGFNQVYNAGLTSDQQTMGLIPQMMQSYRQQELSPLIPAMAGLEGWNAANNNVTNYGLANLRNAYGLKQPKGNWADKLDSSIGDILGLVGSIYGMGGGGMGDSISIGGGNYDNGKGGGGGGGL